MPGKVDAFSFTWPKSLICSINLYSLVGRALRKVMNEKGNVIVVMPDWRNITLGNGRGKKSKKIINIQEREGNPNTAWTAKRGTLKNPISVFHFSRKYYGNKAMVREQKIL